MTLRRYEVEAWVLRIVEDVLAGRPAEDDVVELKTDWPDDWPKAARRIAAHANSARQQPILWIIGLDEKARAVPGASAIEISDWIAKLRSEFCENWMPTPSVYHVPVRGVTVSAIVFDTEGIPFVVKAPNERLEVPWRSGNRTRSAKRSELFSIVSQPVLLPILEFLFAEIILWNPKAATDRRSASGEASFYVTPRSSQAVSFPYHRLKGWIQAPTVEALTLESIYISNGDYGLSTQDLTIRRPPNIETDGVQVTVVAAGYFQIRFQVDVTDVQGALPNEWELQFYLIPAGSETGTLVKTLLPAVQPRQKDFSNQWRFKHDGLSRF